MVAAASKEIPEGMWQRALALVTTRLLKLEGPKPTTLSPGANVLALLPTFCTIPENSSPKVGPVKPFSIASSGSRPRVYMISRKLRPVACTSTSISSSIGVLRERIPIVDCSVDLKTGSQERVSACLFPGICLLVPHSEVHF